jgi:hypothetical protein
MRIIKVERGELRRELRRNLLGVRWSDGELKLVTAAAHDKWMPASAFIRQLVLERLAGGDRKGTRATGKGVRQ